MHIQFNINVQYSCVLLQWLRLCPRQGNMSEGVLQSFSWVAIHKQFLHRNRKISHLCTAHISMICKQWEPFSLAIRRWNHLKELRWTSLLTSAAIRLAILKKLLQNGGNWSVPSGRSRRQHDQTVSLSVRSPFGSLWQIEKPRGPVTPPCWTKGPGLLLSPLSPATYFGEQIEKSKNLEVQKWQNSASKPKPSSSSATWQNILLHKEHWPRATNDSNRIKRRQRLDS